MDTFVTLLKIKLKHDYYVDGCCKGMNLTIGSETQQLFSRRGVLFRQSAVGEWSLIAQKADPFRTDEPLYLYLQQTDPCFYYFTQSETTYDEKTTRLLPLPVCLTEDKNGSLSVQEMSLFFQARQVYWEYLFISRSGRPPNNLILSEMEERIIFGNMETVEYEGMTAYRFQSTEKIRLKESYLYELSLVELVNTSKRTLLRRIPFPQPGRILNRDANTITQIQYF